MHKLSLQNLLWIFLVLACPGFLHAHMDRIIELKGAALVGLPKEFEPAEFETFRLRIGKHEMTFSPYLQNLFEQPHDLLVTASWYHENSILPPYINLHVKPKSKDYSYKLLLNLKTLDVIELSVELRTKDSKTWTLPIQLDDRIKKEIRESIRTAQ